MQTIEALKRRDEGNRDRISELEERIARMEEQAPRGSTDLWSRPVGKAQVRLMDIGLSALMTAGSSSERGDDLEDLQAGAHDPRQRGFTLNQLELSFLGAVDPYMYGQAYLVFQIDDQGETKTELEDAYVTTQKLPFALEEKGLELEAGQFFTEFGRNNPTHPHSWAFVDQPFVVSRLLGGDGMRAPGVRASWLTPLPWFSELKLGMQNSRGEAQVSFLAMTKSSTTALSADGRPPMTRSTA